MSAKKKPAKKAARKVAKKASAKKTVAKKATPARPSGSPAAATANLLEPLGGGWTITPLSLEAAAETGRRSRVGAAATDPLPDFLRGPDFETLQAAELKTEPGRRRAAGEGEGPTATASSLQLAADVPGDAAVLLSVRQESGALSFHRPLTTIARRGNAAGAGTRVIFDVPLSSAAPDTARRGPISKIVRVVLVKVVKEVVGAITSLGSSVIVPILASQLEKQLWRNRSAGWVRVSRELLSGPADTMKPVRPAMAAGQRGLLFIHGTFSSCYGGFRDLAAGPFFDVARELYGSNIYGFNHFTFSATPEENVKDLLDSLPAGTFEFDVITHSRGGLVVRELLEGSGLGHPRRNDIKIGRVIMVASPSLGTPLASPSHWDAKLSFWANLIELLPDNPFSTGAAWLAEALKWFASDVLGNCEGLAAMDPGGDFITAIKEPPDVPPGTEYHAVVSNFHPPREWLARLGDMAVDSFFGEANDLVVPSEGAWKTSDAPTTWIAGARIACFGAGGNIASDELVHHCNYFSQDETRNYITAVLGGKPSPFAALDPAADLPDRRLRRSGAARLALPAVAAAAAPAAPVPAPVLAGPPEVVPEDEDAWNKEECLFLTVVSGEEDEEEDEEEKELGKKAKRRPVPVLLASYGSARVAVPFRTHGKADNAGARWQKIIGMQKFLVGYANGQPTTYTMPDPDERSFDLPTEDFLEAFGDELFRTLFAGEVRILYNIARFQHARRRLNIIFTSMIPWVADLPWEIAFDQSCETFLSCADVRFIRNVLTPTPANRIEPDRDKLRILVVAAQPAGLGSLSVEDERHAIYESFRPLIDSQLADVEVITGVTAELLHIKLRTPGAPEFDVLHFIGHGEFDEKNKTGYLIFESEDRRAQRISAASFLNIVRSRNIRVVFLNACETGRGKGSSYNRGVAMALARDGIHAVVANQYSVIDRSASLFSLHFYACLAHGLNLGDAMREARIAIQYKGVEPMDWGVPVIFACEPDARLCRPNSKVFTKAFLSPQLPPPAPVVLEEAPAAVPPSGPPSARGMRAARAGAGPGPLPPVTVPRKVVSVWDAENSLAYRENIDATLAELNAAQDSFAFRFERFSAPRDLWTRSDKKTTGSVAYLRAETAIDGLNRIKDSIGSDYLFCVTGLPLRDTKTTALYFYPDRSVSIFSTWALEPPLEGILLKRAIANYAAISLLYELSPGSNGGSSSKDRAHPIHTVGYYNDERSVAHIAGKMTITPRTMTELQKAARATPGGEHQLASIQALLSLYHEGGQEPG